MRQRFAVGLLWAVVAGSWMIASDARSDSHHGTDFGNYFDGYHDSESLQNRELPHLDLQLTGAELEELEIAKSLSEAISGHRITQQSVVNPNQVPREFTEIRNIGTRGLRWIEEINKVREQPFQLWRREDMRGMPIEEPARYGPRMILERFEKLKLEIPQTLGSILWGNMSFPESLPEDDETFRLWMQKLDTVYSLVIRWEFMLPYLNGLAQRKSQDITGYYMLQKEPQLEKELRGFSQLSVERKNQLRVWLLNLCDKYRTPYQCSVDLAETIEKSEVYGFFQKYLSRNEHVYRNFFRISFRNSDVRVNQQGITIPLVEKNTPEQSLFFKTHIEEGWSWGEGFRAVVQTVRRRGIEVDWSPGAFVHVPSVGASKIVLDSNRSLSERVYQMLIRHEFGHVLGFPDCYLEYYETNERELVSYQIDTNNIMCSQSGEIQEQHIRELLRAYQ